MALPAKKKELIDVLMANPMLPNTQVAKIMGINNKTVGKWLKEPEVQEELARRLQDQWKDGERLAQDTMLSLCREGDFKAAKYILDSLGYAPAQKVDMDLHTDFVINVTDDEE